MSASRCLRWYAPGASARPCTSTSTWTSQGVQHAERAAANIDGPPARLYADAVEEPLGLPFQAEALLEQSLTLGGDLAAQDVRVRVLRRHSHPS